MKMPMTIFCAIALLLMGCTSKYTYMNREAFSEVDIGTPRRVLEDTFGQPIAIHSKKPGTEIYEYQERMQVGRQTVQVKRYFIVVEDGKVIGKYVKVDNQPPFQQIYSDDPYRNYW